jgi:hypothetical protein
MRAYQEQDFEKMATRVVERFMQGEKLADVAALEAQQGQLNPDQIERLVHSANTMAFLRLMDQQKAQGAPDMTGEFDPIDARQIMQLLMSHMGGAHDASGGMPHAAPGGDEMPLPDETQHPGATPNGELPPGMADETNIHMHGDEPDVHVHNTPDEEDDTPPIDGDNDGPFPKGEKQKTKDDGDKKDKPKKGPPSAPKKDEAKEAAFRQRRLRKLAGILDDQLKQAELAFDDAFARLSTCLRRAHGAPSATAFEKDALALYGDNVGVVVLNLVQEDRGWPVTPHGDVGTKVAALTDRHIVDDTEANREFAALVRIASEAARLREGADHVRTQCT